MLSIILKFKVVFPNYKERESHYNYIPLEEDWKKRNLNPACASCHEYKEFGLKGDCPGDFNHSFYYPTDCDSWSGHQDLYDEEEEAYESMFDRGYW